MNNIFEIRNLNYKEIIKDLNINIALNKTNIILGKSGVGKTTLTQLLINEFKKENREISCAFQDNQLIDWLTVKDNLLLVMRDKNMNLIQDVLKALRIDHLVNRFPVKLSGGERQRVNLARCFLNENEFIIFDEPFNSLDYENRLIAIKFIKEYIVNKTAIIVTHDLDIVLLFEAYINILTRDSKMNVVSIDNLDRHLTMDALLNALMIKENF